MLLHHGSNRVNDIRRFEDRLVLVEVKPNDRLREHRIDGLHGFLLLDNHNGVADDTLRLDGVRDDLLYRVVLVHVNGVEHINGVVYQHRLEHIRVLSRQFLQLLPFLSLGLNRTNTHAHFEAYYPRMQCTYFVRPDKSTVFVHEGIVVMVVRKTQRSACVAFDGREIIEHILHVRSNEQFRAYIETDGGT